MKALTWHGKSDIRCESVPDPKIQHPRDAIIKVTACAICGSDLHIFNGVMPGMEGGDILGHETMGEVVEVGAENKALKVGDRVVVPFTISCGECFFCKKGFFSGCERTNPDKEKAEKLWGHSPAGLFGYTHLLGGYAGGQAEYLRVPYADVGPINVPNGLTDERNGIFKRKLGARRKITVKGEHGAADDEITPFGIGAGVEICDALYFGGDGRHDETGQFHPARFGF